MMFRLLIRVFRRMGANKKKTAEDDGRHNGSTRYEMTSHSFELYSAPKRASHSY